MKTSMRQPTRSAKKSYGPNIVRAWFDTVFHYILAGLETEKGFLARRNWTFRHSNGKLEYIASVARHVPSAATENLEQFVAFFPEVGALIERHDHCVQQLESRCAAYSDAIVESANFLTTFRRVEAESPAVLRHEFNRNFGAYSSEEDFKRILAEYLVNNIESLFNYFTTAALWNRYQTGFFRSVAVPELTPLREATDRAGSDLIEAVDELVALMKKTRSELSLKHDVPFVAELSSVR
jgi:hypothetical protein